MVLYCIVWPGVRSEEISLLRRLFLRTFEEDYFNLLLYTKICFEIYVSIIAIKDFFKRYFKILSLPWHSLYNFLGWVIIPLQACF